MSKNLVIVESPAKAKTIEKFLGPDFRVLSSRGHVRDIEAIGRNSMGIDFANHYQPNYVVEADKQVLIEQLRAEVKKADIIWLASDEDREGEAIAWHLYEVLGLEHKQTHRIVFHEITKTAIQEAILHPRTINYNLVNAQQARRVLDRIVGFELSPVLWKKVTTGLSAGRVQSVVVRLVVEREREIEAHKYTSQYRVLADFIGCNPSDASILKTELSQRFKTRTDAEAFLQQCQHASFSVSDIQRKPQHRLPAPPFTTSSLQQEAGRKLKFSVSKTMRIAQSLYEAGRITYMRTDSVNLSQLALATTRQAILEQYGERYAHTRQYHTNSKGAQEAHEAIRPTYMNVQHAGANTDEQRLYELIWKRTMACQMADAEVETTRIEVQMNGTPYHFVATGEIITFDGFTRAYVQSVDDQEEEHRILPQMALHEQLRYAEITAQQTFNHPPYRYNETTLVKKMEELGIGRPSTYAATIETIQSRKYVERSTVPGQKRTYTELQLKHGTITEHQRQEIYGADSQKLLPTDLGRITNDFLVEQFPHILSYDFTAQEEERFDSIALGQADWVQTVDDFYQAFHPALAAIPSGKVEGRLLGNDPKTGLPVLAKISRIGPCVQLGSTEQEKPRFASLQKGQSLFSITLEEALQLFEHTLPYSLGEIEGKEVIVGEGKYGVYLRYQDNYISVSRGVDPFSITLEQAEQIISAAAAKETPIMQWDDIQVLIGRYGPYIKTSKGNYKLPRNTQADTLTEQQCRDIIANSQPAAKSTPRRTFHKAKK